ncbi:MAG: nucleotidyltransferase domain-containing protein [Candidatus Omnitrophota bacterium]|nr:nucleotidyltransferase domain-containing protein [Candidatus Omnitrophota bacterium]
MNPISIRQIRVVARKIGRQLRPKKVILFGSYAYGHPNADSDVDLFIVMPSRQRPAERAASVSKLLHPRPFPVDILVRTPQEVRRRLALGDSFIEEIVTRGKILYEV